MPSSSGRGPSSDRQAEAGQGPAASGAAGKTTFTWHSFRGHHMWRTQPLTQLGERHAPVARRSMFGVLSKPGILTTH